jgi:excisionase family DNA binding protein
MRSLNPAPTPRLTVTLAEAAQLLGIGRTTLQQLVTDGVVPSIKLGRRRLIARVELNNLLTPARPTV